MLLVCTYSHGTFTEVARQMILWTWGMHQPLTGTWEGKGHQDSNIYFNLLISVEKPLNVSTSGFKATENQCMNYFIRTKFVGSNSTSKEVDKSFLIRISVLSICLCLFVQESFYLKFRNSLMNSSSNACAVCAVYMRMSSMSSIDALLPTRPTSMKYLP